MQKETYDSVCSRFIDAVKMHEVAFDRFKKGLINADALSDSLNSLQIVNTELREACVEALRLRAKESEA